MVRLTILSSLPSFHGCHILFDSTRQWVPRGKWQTENTPPLKESVGVMLGLPTHCSLIGQISLTRSDQLIGLHQSADRSARCISTSASLSLFSIASHHRTCWGYGPGTSTLKWILVQGGMKRKMEGGVGEAGYPNRKTRNQQPFLAPSSALILSLVDRVGYRAWCTVIHPLCPS